MKAKTALFSLVAFALGIFLGYYFGFDVGFEKAVDKSNETLFDNSSNIKNFSDCVNAGFPIMESYPRQCRTGAGVTFTEELENVSQLADLIVIDNPVPFQTVTSPINISGKARGTWFFEASAPVKLLDEEGNLLKGHFIEAVGEWMTEDFVPFEGELEFISGEAGSGVLVFEKSNPSGLDERNQEVRIPVSFE